MSESFLDKNLTKDEKELEYTLDKISFLEENDALDYAHILFPKWILHQTRHYTNEYSNLERNWNELCQRWNTKTKFILIVSFIPANNTFHEYSILGSICNILTKHGYVIRNQTQLSCCQMCERAILSKNAWTYLDTQFKRYIKSNPQQHSIPRSIPDEWNAICKACRDKTD